MGVCTKRQVGRERGGAEFDDQVTLIPTMLIKVAPRARRAETNIRLLVHAMFHGPRRVVRDARTARVDVWVHEARLKN